MIFRDPLMLEIEEVERIKPGDDYVEGTSRYIKFPKDFTEDDKCDTI